MLNPRFDNASNLGLEGAIERDEHIEAHLQAERFEQRAYQKAASRHPNPKLLERIQEAIEHNILPSFAIEVAPNCLFENAISLYLDRHDQPLTPDQDYFERICPIMIEVLQQSLAERPDIQSIEVVPGFRVDLDWVDDCYTQGVMTEREVYAALLFRAEYIRLERLVEIRELALQFAE